MVSYFKVAPDTGEREPLPDRSALERLIRVDFVRAQRHIDDQENHKLKNATTSYSSTNTLHL
jgi:hypothetical protein